MGNIMDNSICVYTMAEVNETNRLVTSSTMMAADGIPSLDDSNQHD